MDKLKDQEGQVMSSAGTGTRQRQMKTKQSSAFSLKTIWAGVCVQEFPEWMGERTEKGWQIDGETVETMSDSIFGLQNHCRW